ncbi:MAG: response regulator [Candidatus Dormibacteria bacterium]
MAKSVLEALVLEDDPTQIDQIAKEVSKVGFSVFRAESVREAMEKVERRATTGLPALAIVDWDMGMNSDQALSVRHFLKWFRDLAKSCTVIVYSVHADTLAVNKAIHEADAWAYSHNKDEGLDSLVARLRQLFGVHVEDLVLEVDTNTVLCEVTGARFVHPVGAMLLERYPHPVDLHRSEGRIRACHRLRGWLQDQASVMTVVPAGPFAWRLAIAAPPARSEP